MQSPIISSSGSPATCSGGWTARTQARPPRLCGSSLTCSSPTRMHPANAMAGVGVQVPGNTTNTPSVSPTGRHGGSPPSTSFSGRSASPSTRPTNSPLQILVRAAKEARVASAAPADLSEISSRLAMAQSWPGLQVLALQYQGRLDQRSVVAVLQKAAQLTLSAGPNNSRTTTATTSPSSTNTSTSTAATAPAGGAASVASVAVAAAPSASEQYACARFLESIAMSCASLIPAMGPSTVAAVLGALGALADYGLVPLRQVPYMVVVLVQALILASLPQLHNYNGTQLAFVLRGCALLSPSGLPEVWLDEWQSVTSGSLLADMSPEALDAVVASLEALYITQNWMPQDPWLRQLLEAVEKQLGEYDGLALRHLVLALAGLEVRPNNGWFGRFRQVFDQRVAAAEVNPQDVAGVLYALNKLEVAFV